MLVITVPAKLILFGEYAVCKREGSALAIAVDKFSMTLTVQITKTESFPDDHCKTLFQTACSILQCPYRESIEVKISSSIPIGMGMGSSSALCVGLAVTAFEYSGKSYSNEELYQLALAMERIHFSPKVSGVDTRACVEGGCIQVYGNGTFHQVEIKDICLSLFMTDQVHSTKNVLSVIDMDIQKITKINNLIEDFKKHHKNIHRVRDMFMTNQVILRSVGVSTAENESMCDNICETAKISGSGFGGVMIGYGVCDYANSICRKTDRGVESVSTIPLYLSRLNLRLNVHTRIGNASAPSNIALIKYWGKEPGKLQTPINSSVSLTLSDLRSYTTVQFLPVADQRPNSFSCDKIDKFLDRINPFVGEKRIHFESRNGFPTGCGIASSASGYCALVGAIGDALDISSHLSIDDVNYWLENWCRIGSGSASRSIYPGAVSWTVNNRIRHQSVEDMNLIDFIVVFNSKEKEISSSLGHESTKNSLFQHYRSGMNNYEAAMKVLEGRDMRGLTDLVENDCMMIHAVMQTGTGKTYLSKECMEFIEQFMKYRNCQNMRAFFTIDAGPNPHIIVHKDDEVKFKTWLVENTLGWELVLVNRNFNRGLCMHDVEPETFEANIILKV